MEANFKVKERIMKNVLKAKAVLRIAGIIALVAVFGFSMAACDDDYYYEPSSGSSGYLPAPTGLRVTASGTTIYLSWNYVSGASGYKVYYNTTSASST